jgi:hypothetical protein
MTVIITNVLLAALDATTQAGPVDVEFDGTITAVRAAGAQAAVGDVVDGAGRILEPTPTR